MTNGGTVPVPPLVMVVQTLYHTTKVHCNGAANIRSFEKRCCKHFAAPTLTDRLMTNHWAGVSGNGNRIISRWRSNLKRKGHLSPWHGPKHIPIICHLPDPPFFHYPLPLKEKKISNKAISANFRKILKWLQICRLPLRPGGNLNF
jgi:hypothetical protein